jgi:hypothetical protein
MANANANTCSYCYPCAVTITNVHPMAQANAYISANAFAQSRRNFDIG